MGKEQIPVRGSVIILERLRDWPFGYVIKEYNFSTYGNNTLLIIPTKYDREKKQEILVQVIKKKMRITIRL